SRKINSVDEIVQGLGMPLLGTVPALPRSGWRRLAAEGAEADTAWDAVLTESLDATRTLLLHSARVHSVRSIMITSGAGSGAKPTSAPRLAASLARAGRKVLLIDCDLRSPTAHRFFDLPRKNGLSELLCGTAEIVDVIKPTPIGNLSLL